MRILPLPTSGIDRRTLTASADTIRQGGVVIAPTDSLYALCCDGSNARAIERICRSRDIDPRRRPLSLMCADIAAASGYAAIDNRAFRLLRDNTPGAFTFLLPVREAISRQFRERRVIGLRIPDHTFMQELIAEAGCPLMVASVTDPDGNPMTDPDEMAVAYASGADLLLDRGEGGTTPTTIVDLTDSAEPTVVREGKGVLR